MSEGNRNCIVVGCGCAAICALCAWIGWPWWISAVLMIAGSVLDALYRESVGITFK